MTRKRPAFDLVEFLRAIQYWARPAEGQRVEHLYDVGFLQVSTYVARPNLIPVDHRGLVIDSMIQMTTSGEARIREQAADVLSRLLPSLGKSEKVRVLSRMMDLLDDPERRVRLIPMDWIFPHKDRIPRSLRNGLCERLVGLTGHPDSWIRRQAFLLIRNFWIDELPGPLRQRLGGSAITSVGDPQEDIRNLAYSTLWALFRRGWEPAGTEKRLRDALQDPSDVVRQNVARDWVKFAMETDLADTRRFVAEQALRSLELWQEAPTDERVSHFEFARLLFEGEPVPWKILLDASQRVRLFDLALRLVEGRNRHGPEIKWTRDLCAEVDPERVSCLASALLNAAHDQSRWIRGAALAAIEKIAPLLPSERLDPLVSGLLELTVHWDLGTAREAAIILHGLRTRLPDELLTKVRTSLQSAAARLRLPWYE